MAAIEVLREFLKLNGPSGLSRLLEIVPEHAILDAFRSGVITIVDIVQEKPVFDYVEFPASHMDEIKLLSSDMTPNANLFARVTYSNGETHGFSVLGYSLYERNGATALGAWICFGDSADLVLAQTIDGFDGFYNAEDDTGGDDEEDDDDDNSDNDYPFDMLDRVIGRKLKSLPVWLN